MDHSDESEQPLTESSPHLTQTRSGKNSLPISQALIQDQTPEPLQGPPPWATGISLTPAWLVCPCSDSSSPTTALAQSAHFCLRLDPPDPSPRYAWGSFHPILPSVGPNVNAAFPGCLIRLRPEPSPHPLQHPPPASPASALPWHLVVCSLLYSDYHPSEA